MGLYIARDLLRRQVGDAALSNGEDGLRAEIWLPRASADEAAGQQEP
jgi:hypothetical protein